MTVAASYTWGNLTAVIDLVGPKGYIHGWIFVGIPGPGQEVSHPAHGHGVVTSTEGGRVQVSFDSGHSASFSVRAQQGPGHFEQMTDDELAAEYNRSEGSRAKAVTDELDRRDQRDQDAGEAAKTQRVAALYAEQPKTEADRNRVYQSLVNEGESSEDAWAHAHSTSTGAMAKQSAIQQLRAQGYTGSGFDALTRAAYQDDIRRRTVMAENATNGYMLGPAGKKAGIDPYSLFTGPESRARKYASPELKEWFDQNGRPTVADFQAQMTGQKVGAGPRDFYASVTWDDMAAVIELSARAHKEDPVTPAPPQAPPRRRGVTPLTPMRVQAAKSMSRLAGRLKADNPDLPAHQHLMDAARMLRAGNEEASQRHLRAAMFSLTPQSLMRNGMHTDDLHLAARDAMHGVHRHLLLVKDIADVNAKNQQAIRRDSGDGFTTPPTPDPNNGYGPGALAQKPTARQPPGDQALNAPNRTSSGGSDPAVADPVGPQPKGSKQFTTQNGVRTVTDLAYGWDDLAGVAARVIEMSAETAALEVTPAPRGKPGGPGLYGVKNNMHSPYLQQIVKALIAKGMDPGKAYAVAWGSMRRWERGGGKVTPEVRAAAAGGLALEKVAEARALAHSGGRAVELVGPKGFSHGWVFHGTADMAPEDKADRMSKNISRHAFSDGPDGDEAKSANREAAKAHRQAAKLSSSPSAVAHHQKMAKLHSAMAGGKMYSANAEKQMSFARSWDDVLRVLEFVQRPGYRVIELDWAAWDAGEKGEASQKAHDTASATAKRDTAAKSLLSAGSYTHGLTPGSADHTAQLGSLADEADRTFPSAKPGSDIRAAADSFGKGDAEGANSHLEDARTKLRGATEPQGKGIYDPVHRQQISLDSILKTNKGQAQMMAQQQDDEAKAAAKAAKKAARSQSHSNADRLRDIRLAATQARVAAGSAGGGQFTAGGSSTPDAHQQHVAHEAHVAAQAKQGQSASSAKSSATASKNAKAKIAASKQSKQGLLGQAASDKKQAAGLSAKRKTLQAQLASLASASGATSSGQAGSTTSAGASTTASSAPAAASTAATTAASTASSAASTAASAASPTAAQLTTQIGALTTQINTLMKAAAQASAQAAKM